MSFCGLWSRCGWEVPIPRLLSHHLVHCWSPFPTKTGTWGNGGCHRNPNALLDCGAAGQLSTSSSCSKPPAISKDLSSNHTIPLVTLVFTWVVYCSVCISWLGSHLVFLVDVNFLWCLENFLGDQCKYWLGYTQWKFSPWRPIISHIISHLFLYRLGSRVWWMLTDEIKRGGKWPVPAASCHPFDLRNMVAITRILKINF